MFETQFAVDAAFADLDALLDKQRHVPASGVCVNCGGTSFDRGSNAGQVHCYYDVCTACGAVAASTYGQTDAERYPARMSSSNYKRIHHWHERISQLMLQESQIPRGDFMQIAERLLDGTHAVINKDVIRTVLRSLNMQLYIEKWLQIIQRITGIEPPKPGGRLLQMLDTAFTELQQPFKHYKDTGRKNFLNYNYVFCRLFQKLGCTQFCMFFPLIKSKQKLKALDETWHKMCNILGWEITALESVPPFSVHLEQHDLLLSRLVHRYVAPAPVAPPPDPWRKGFPRWGRFGPSTAQLGLKRPRSSQTEPEVQGPAPKSMRCR